MQPQPQPPPPMPIPDLRWTLVFGAAPDGTGIALLTLAQGNLQMQIQIGARDMQQLGKSIEDAARRELTGLVVPGPANGGPHA